MMTKPEYNLDESDKARLEALVVALDQGLTVVRDDGFTVKPSDDVSGKRFHVESDGDDWWAPQGTSSRQMAEWFFRLRCRCCWQLIPGAFEEEEG